MCDSSHKKVCLLFWLVIAFFLPYLFFFLKFLDFRLGRNFLWLGWRIFFWSFTLLFNLSLRCCAKWFRSDDEILGTMSPTLLTTCPLLAALDTIGICLISLFFSTVTLSSSIRSKSPLCSSWLSLRPRIPEWNRKSHRLIFLLGVVAPFLGRLPLWGSLSGIFSPFLGLNPMYHPIPCADWMVWKVLESRLEARLGLGSLGSRRFSLNMHSRPFLPTRRALTVLTRPFLVKQMYLSVVLCLYLTRGAMLEEDSKCRDGLVLFVQVSFTNCALVCELFRPLVCIKTLSRTTVKNPLSLQALRMK